ncbi:MAG: hypothetical protein ACPGVG_12375 [Mycobacterium sp.]
MLRASTVPSLPTELADDWFGLATWVVIAAAAVILVVMVWRVWLGVKQTNGQVVNGGNGGSLDQRLGRIEKQVTEVHGSVCAEKAHREHIQANVENLTSKFDSVTRLLEEALGRR